MKILDFETIRDAARSMNPSTWYDWVDDALRHKDEFLMPLKSRMSQADGDYYNIMPAMYEKDNLAMLKMIGRHSIKRGEHRSTMMGDILLYEADTGILKALMDAEYITTLRTGVVAAHSAMLFVREGGTIGLIGLGNIMTVCFTTLLSKLHDEYPLTVKLYRHHDQELRFVERFKDCGNVCFEFCDSYEEVVRDSDLVISAVTRATENFAADNCYKEGVTVIPICTLGFQNCDLFFDKVYTDEIEQIRGFKYFNQFKAVYNVTDVLKGRAPGRTNSKERILVYNYGIGIHDLYFAKKFYDIIQGKEIEYRFCKDKYFV
jgi:ornithine cyclodeaminase/alanine dehydrogenase-like protein (mu-crystallin family)